VAKGTHHRNGDGFREGTDPVMEHARAENLAKTPRTPDDSLSFLGTAYGERTDGTS